MLVAFTILMVFRLSYMLANESGPYEVVERVRGRFEDNRLFDFECFCCISVWVAFIPAFFLADGWQIIVYWFGLSAAAMIVNELYKGWDELRQLFEDRKDS